MGLDAVIADTGQAWRGARWWQRVHFHLLGRRPPRLGAFGKQVEKACRSFEATVLLATGIAPLSAATLRSLKPFGIRSVNFLTDDPWNPRQRASFFKEAVRNYDTVYTPRRANFNDLRNQGCVDVRYLPFSYGAQAHFPEESNNAAERERYACDLAFIGSADNERAQLMRHILRAGVRLLLYGGAWDRFPDLRVHHRGVVVGRELRLAVSGARINLCMGRAANRDGHAMRSLELPAMGACMVVEDTDEHRDLFGADCERVRYYRGPDDLLARVRELLADSVRARRLAAAVHAHICAGQHTYEARLAEILNAHGS
jgi:spore maturation protein CgeB